MNKVLELLEQYCQWLAIALGGAFLALMVWYYLLFSPVAVQSGGTTLTPSTVDDTVRHDYADPLDDEMRREQVDPAPPQHVPEIEQFASALDPKNDNALALRKGWPASIPQEATLASAEAPTTQESLVEKLPNIPPSEIVDLKSARAFVQPPANLANNQQPAPQPQPNGAPAAPVGRDLTYVRLEYRIAPDDLAKAFDAVKIPSAFTNTSVAAITVYREEQLPDGSWSTPTQVPPINNGTDIEQPPAANAGPAAIPPFRQWFESQQGQSDLLRPPFYQITQGEGPWDPPADALPVVDPEVEKQKRIAAYKQRMEEERQKRMQSAQQHSDQGPPGGMPGMPPGMGGGGGYGRGGPQPLEWPQVRPPNYPPNYPRGGFPPNMPPGMRPPMGMGDQSDQGNQGMQPPQQQAPGSGMPNASALPSPMFRPSDTQPFVCWAYDETVKEATTYRYQVCYAIRNPVFGSNIVKNPADAQQLLIWSQVDDNAWSQPVFVKPSAEFYLSGPSWAGSTQAGVRVQVFKWSQGMWQSKVFTVSPGDEIGGLDNKTDYSTNSTVVDVRYDPRAGRAYMLVLAPDGKLVEHDPAADKANPRLAQLTQIIQQQAQNAPGGPPNQPGVGPGGVPGVGMNPGGGPGLGGGPP